MHQFHFKSFNSRPLRWVTAAVNSSEWQKHASKSVNSADLRPCVGTASTFILVELPVQHRLPSDSAAQLKQGGSSAVSLH